MDYEAAQELLAQRRKPGAALTRLNRAFRIPGEVREFAREVLEEQNAYRRDQLIASRRGAIGPLFAGLNERGRKRLIHTLLPHIEEAVEAGWELLALRPYQHGLTRKPFRCPRSAQTLADSRGAWLLSITAMLGDIDEDIEWVAAWAAYLAGWAGATDLGWLLAGVIDAGGATGERVFEILKQSATGEHEVGQMGRHVTQALMSCSRQDAWEFVERLLLAAQRQEGLRQAILEAVDESHPGAFRRMIRLIREQNLARFSSVVRAFDTWFGFMWDGSSGIKVDEVLGTVERFFEDADARDAALAGTEPEPAYLALWTIAFEDIDAAIPGAIELLRADTAELHFVATHFLAQALWTTAIPPLVDMLADPDLRVAARALDVFLKDATSLVPAEQLFDRLEALHARVGKRPQTLDPIVWPWWRIRLDRQTVAAAMAANGRATLSPRLLPYVRDLDPPRRAATLRYLAGLAEPRQSWQFDVAAEPRKREALSAEVRGLVLEMLGDASAMVRQVAFEALAGSPVEDDEVERLIALLGRQAGDLRSGCLTRLQTLDDDRLEASIERLLADADAQRRAAGLELLRHASAAGRLGDRLRAIAERYRAAHPDAGETERSHLEAVLGATDRPPTLDDALGLVTPGALRTWPDPRERDVTLETPAARASLISLARLVLEHQATEVRVGGEVKTLVAAPYAVPHPGSAETAKDRLEQLPLADVWRAWLVDREPALRDADGLELVRLLALEPGAGPWAAEEVVRLNSGRPWRPGEQILRSLLAWCVCWQPPAGGAAFLVDAFEAALAALTAEDFAKLLSTRSRYGVVYPDGGYYHDISHSERLVAARHRATVVREWRDLHPGRFEGDLATRFYGLLRWFLARSGGLNVLFFRLEDFLSAYRAGGADEAEFIDLLVGRTAPGTAFELLRWVSGRSPKEIAGHPALLEAVERCRRRIVEIECRRGDQMTAASPAAMRLRWTGGLETLAAALPALGTAKFSRSGSWLSNGESRKDVLSRLVLRSTPREGDTLEAFAAWARQAKLTSDRLVELAVYAPQWARHVQHVLGWPGLESAVWWIEAHTKDDRSWELAELKELWAAQIAERTPLAASDLTEGAVDVAWFRAAYAALGAERWKKLDRAARYASSAGGHKRAQLFAQAMLGEVAEAELVRRIEQKRHQDAVRALGLLPLAEGEVGKQDVLRRYRVLQEFRRGSRKFGSQRQQSEGRAFAIGLANLARTAGYADPLRLQWAMERELVADLAEGPVTRTKGDVELTLRLSDDGQPELEVRKGGRALKSVPAALRKDPEVAELRERVSEIRKQASRVKRALEEAMCRGDTFTGPELQELLRHPVLAPALSRLVFTGEGTLGYPAEGGRALRDHTGRLEPVGTTERLRIAHPCDLLERGDWAAWQRECFRAERVQPFKQVFRELYVPTAAEREQKQSSRYAGHQVNPRQAVALLGQRGWVAHPEEGVHRTFHDEGLTARLYFQETFYTPADVEGLTLDTVCFTRKGEYEELWLRDIPPRVFSETMRDLDLVVSVAHQGGVDPEATASTVEMRAALLRETCELLGLDNVELQANHAIVRGELATYSVHLGSAVASVLPGAALHIVAVHSQHRGRLFLPFADDDPRTAEVLSKVLLLARDREIKDPSILDQIRSATRGVPA